MGLTPDIGATLAVALFHGVGTRTTPTNVRQAIVDAGNEVSALV